MTETNGMSLLKKTKEQRNVVVLGTAHTQRVGLVVPTEKEPVEIVAFAGKLASEMPVPRAVPLRSYRVADTFPAVGPVFAT